MSKTLAAAQNAREKINAQLDEFLAKNGKVEQLATTQLKPYNFVIDTKKEVLRHKTKPVRITA
jgi:hypothetical protein